MLDRHSHLTEQGRCFWYVDRLWKLAEGLPIKTVRLDSISEFDQNCWFDENYSATIRDVATHAKRIYEADLAHPIILSAKGFLMDGGHRLAKAWLLGLAEIQAVQFVTDPEPDWVVPVETM